jgi:TolB-like protein/DNA-binding winged helix-turn-helix (wHTH) protein
MQKIQHETCSFGEFTLDLTRGCLRRGNEEIKLRPKSFEALKYLVANHGRLVTKAELLDAVWPDAFVTENSLVQCLIEVRRALGDTRQEFIKTVPRRGYLFAAEVIEGESAAHAIDVDRDEIVIDIGDGPEEQTQPSQNGETARARTAVLEPHVSSPARTRRLLPTALIVVCAAALVVGSLLWYRHRAAPTLGDVAPIGSIAVLPLRNLTNDTENDYFADGLTESLITSLSKLDKLKVISRGSVFGFKGKDIDPREIGRQLGVAAVLEGSIRSDRDRVRVDVHLASTDDGRVLWSNQTDSFALKEILSLQDEVARSVASGLRGKLNGEAQAPGRLTGDAEAYQLYLKGRYFWNKRVPDALTKAVDYLEQAKARDPNFALAHAGLADCYVLFPEYRMMAPNEAFSKARTTATKALEIDGQLAEARASLAYTLAFYDWNWTGAEKEFKRAIELNPNYATAHQWYSEYLLAFGRFDESLSELRQAESLDPLSLVIKSDIAGHFYVARQYDEAIDECHKINEMDPSFAWGYGFLWHAYKGKGMDKEAFEGLHKAYALWGESPEHLEAEKNAYAKSGWKGFWRTRLEQVQNAKTGYVQAIDRAIMYIELGDKEKAIGALQESYAARERWMANIKFAPEFDPLRSDPRFQELERRIGLTQ